MQWPDALARSRHLARSHRATYRRSRRRPNLPALSRTSRPAARAAQAPGPQGAAFELTAATPRHRPDHGSIVNTPRWIADAYAPIHKSGRDEGSGADYRADRPCHLALTPKSRRLAFLRLSRPRPNGSGREPARWCTGGPICYRPFRLAVPHSPLHHSVSGSRHIEPDRRFSRIRLTAKASSMRGYGSVRDGA